MFPFPGSALALATVTALSSTTGTVLFAAATDEHELTNSGAWEESQSISACRYSGVAVAVYHKRYGEHPHLVNHGSQRYSLGMTNAAGTDVHFTVKDKEYDQGAEDVVVAVRNDIVVEAHHSRDDQLRVIVGKVKFDSHGTTPTTVDWGTSRRVHIGGGRCSFGEYPGDKVNYMSKWTHLSVHGAEDGTGLPSVQLWYMPNDADKKNPQWTFQQLNGVVRKISDGSYDIDWHGCETSKFTTDSIPPSRTSYSPLKNGPNSTLSISNSYSGGFHGKVTYSVSVRTSQETSNQDNSSIRSKIFLGRSLSS